MPEEIKQKASPGRIVLVVIGQAVKGKEVQIIRRPAIVSQALADGKIEAHVFMDGARDGDWAQTQFRKDLPFDGKGKTIGSWAFPDRVE